MKKNISVLVCISLWGMYSTAQYAEIKTPTNVAIETIDNSEGDVIWLATMEADAAKWISDYHLDAVRIGSASHTYNCHCYAWNSSDGGVKDWIDQIDRYGGANISKYFSGSNPTYTSTTLDMATKIFLPTGDHSMISSTTSPGWYESKWGNWPLYKHSLYSHPYVTTGMQFYKLNITGVNFACISA
jgi:hypothetical protein